MLLGLAIWSSEFEWAHRLMMSFKAQLHRFRQWSRPKQVLFWVVFFSCCGLLGYLYASLIGVPGWMPGPGDRTAAAPARRLTAGHEGDASWGPSAAIASSPFGVWSGLSGAFTV